MISWHYLLVNIVLNFLSLECFSLVFSFVVLKFVASEWCKIYLIRTMQFQAKSMNGECSNFRF